MIGRTLSHYEITSRLGKGGMGEVWRATDTRLNREVALKVLPEEMARDPERLERFEREAKAVAALNHPNVVTIHSVEESDGIRLLTMELVEGKSLAEILPAGGFVLDRLVTLAIQITDALVAAHGRGIIHRDLKPTNVMVTDDDRIKVLDFGLAKLAASETQGGDEETQLMTQAGMLLGTIPYMSPEGLQGQPVDHRSDIFSLGILLYEMTTGSRPFRGESAASTLSAVLRDHPPLVTEKRPELPNRLGSIIRRCLEKDREHRYPSTWEVRSELEALSEEVQIRAGSETKADARDDQAAHPTIAVLPFSNLSSDPDNEFLADGMADEIISALTRIESLRVLSRTSSFAFKGRSEDVREIAGALGVSIVLEGSLRRAGDRIRLATQLVNAEDGYHLWSGRFDRGLEDVFAVQEEIAENVADALKIVLSTRQSENPQRLSTDSFEAYELYLRGRSMLINFTDERFRTAQILFRRSVELDEEFLPGWLGLAEASSWIYQWGINARSDKDLRVATEASDRAMQIAPDQPEALAAKGITSWIREDTDAAISFLERAQKQDPRLWQAAFFLARVHMTRGAYDRAVEQYFQAAEIRPDDYQSLCLAMGLLEGMGSDETARQTARRAREVLNRQVSLHPEDARAYYLGTMVHLLLGDEEKARDWARRALDLGPKDTGVLYNLACFYIKVGSQEEALDLLEEAAKSGWGFKEWLETDPDMDAIREHPRFKALLDRMT